MNHDGLDDVVVFSWRSTPTYSGATSVYLNQGSSTSSDVTKDFLPAPIFPDTPRRFTHGGDAADVDCDGYPDLYEGNWPNPQALALSHLQMNRGGLSFMAEDFRLPREIASGARVSESSQFCDLDRDGAPDLILGMAGTPDLVLFNDGLGNFTGRSARLPASLAADNNTIEIACFDYDLDGWNDILLASTTSSNAVYGATRYRLWHNNRDGTFSEATNLFPSSASVGAFPKVSVADLNADGWPALWPGHFDANGRTGFLVFINDGNPTYLLRPTP